MSFFGWGNRTVVGASTGPVSNPTTATLVAEIDCNGTNASVKAGGEPWQVSWIVGTQTTLATFRLEHNLSTGLAQDTASRQVSIVHVSSGQSAQFITKHNVEPGDRFRVRVQSSITASVSATIIGEPLI